MNALQYHGFGLLYYENIQCKALEITYQISQCYRNYRFFSRGFHQCFHGVKTSIVGWLSSIFHSSTWYLPCGSHPVRLFLGPHSRRTSPEGTVSHGGKFGTGSGCLWLFHSLLSCYGRGPWLVLHDLQLDFVVKKPVMFPVRCIF